VLTVKFIVAGIPCLGLNGGPTFEHMEAFSFQIATENQEETDRYCNAIAGNGGTESASESYLRTAQRQVDRGMHSSSVSTEDTH
jgi:predicted 3-demethylubiquinone-9 3-methyltransferase (glyoxalase superfamily)